MVWIIPVIICAGLRASAFEMLDKGDLDAQQKKLNDFRRRTESNLQKIHIPFPRPSRLLYQGQSQILVGVALGLDKPATAAVVDGTTGEAIAYRRVKLSSII